MQKRGVENIHIQRDGVAQERTNWDCFFSQMRIFVTSLILSFCFSFSIFANPEGGQVSAGNAAISSPNANTLHINQSTDKAVIDWRTFNIAPHETTQFTQPTRNSITLNRIDANHGASTIAGKLQANGNIWLINPAGILFSSTAKVDVGGLLAATANISNQDFMAGNYHFIQSPNWNGAIINEGKITVADKGLAVLVAPGVENRGVIQANLGKVVLASGSQYTLDMYGDGLIQFGVDSSIAKPAQDKDGNDLKDAVSNRGKIIANGGTVLLTAQTASKVVRRTINMTGYIQAKSAVQQGGKIILLAGNEGNVYVSGKINASGKRGDYYGGKVQITGKKVILAKKAKIDVSGNKGGGEILIGGDFQGKNPNVQNAKNTFVGNNVELNADAIQKGDGGKIIVWSDDTTQFYGNASARGGQEGGDGGFVEVSGKEFLHFNGLVNTLAPLGKIGTLLLDPRLITVAAGGTATLAQVDSFSDTPSTDLTISAATLNGALSNVVLQANRDIRFNESVNMTTSGVSLTAQAGRDIIVDNISAGNISIKTNNGNILFTANDSNAVGADRATGTGDILMNAGSSIDAGTGNVSFTVGSSTTSPFSPGTITLRDVIGKDISVSTPSTVTLNGTINSSGLVTMAANTDDSGAQSFTMNAGSSISTTNTSANAVSITVNNGSVGTGNAVLRSITTQNGGSRGTLSVTVQGSGDITLKSDEVLTAGTTTLSASDAMVFEAGSSGTTKLDATGPISLLVNTNGAGTNNLTMNSASLITTTDTTSNAVNINVNTATGGAGSATLSSITTGSGGTLTIATNTGNNLTGGDILYGSGSLDVGTGTITLITPKTNGENIATSVAPLQIKAGTLNATAGSSGIFITNTGTPTLTVNTLHSERQDTSAAGPVELTSNTAIQQGTNPVKATTLTLKTLNNSGANITFNNTSNEASTINFKTRNAADTANALGAISYKDLDGIIISGIDTGSTLNLSAGGSITQTGALTIGDTSTYTVTAASSDILLNTQANNFGATPMFTNNGNIRDLGIRNTNASAVVSTLPSGVEDLTLIFDNAAMTLPNVSLSATLTATANGAITQSGALSGTTLTAKTLNNSGANITLNSSSNEFSTINLQSRNAADSADAAGVITYQDASGFNITGLHTTNNSNITAAGAITDSGTTGTIIGGTLTLASGTTNNITLNTATNDFNEVVVSSANSITLVDANSIILGNTNIANNATITASGTISDSGNLIIPGNLNLSGTNITLDSAGNNFDTVIISSGNNATLVDSDGLILGTSSLSGNLDVTAHGNITQSGALTITGTPTFTVTAAASDILLGTSANNFSTTPVFASSGAGSIQDISLRNTAVSATSPVFPSDLRNVTLTFNNAAIALPSLALTGTLTLTAGNAITQTGSLSGTTLTAETHNNLGANITLLNSANDFSSISLQSRNAADNADASGSIQYRDASGFNIASIRTTGNASFTSAGDMTDSGAQIIGGTTTLSAGSSNNITLNTATNNFATVIVTDGNNVTLRDTNGLIMGTSTIYGDLSLTAGGALTQSGALDSRGVTSLNVGATNDITLTDPSNDFASLAITNANNANIVDSNNLILGTSTLAGSYTVTANGSISNNGSVHVPGTLNISAIGGISLNDSGNTITTINLTHSGNGTITLVNTASPFSITGFSHTGGAVNITNTGTLSIADGVTINTGNSALNLTITDLNLNTSGALNSGSADTTITQNSVGGTLTLSSNQQQRITTDNLTLSADNLILTGNINLAGNINLLGDAISINSTIDGPFNLTINAGSQGDITLNADIGSISRLNEFNILSMNNLTNNGLLRANTYTQSAGNLASLGDSLGLDLTNAALIIGENVTGKVNVKSLTLDTNFANLTGLVDGASGRSAIAKITNLNTILRGTHFFDGIDMFIPPTPPTPPGPTPTPAIITDQDIIQYIFPTSYKNQLDIFDMNAMGMSEVASLIEQLDKGIGNQCKNLGSNIILCAQ